MQGLGRPPPSLYSLHAFTDSTTDSATWGEPVAAKKVLMLVGDFTAPAWPVHPEWMRALLEPCGSGIEA